MSPVQNVNYVPGCTTPWPLVLGDKIRTQRAFGPLHAPWSGTEKSIEMRSVHHQAALG